MPYGRLIKWLIVRCIKKDTEVNNVKQVVDGTVNRGKERLNDITRSAGEALKEKIFGFKNPKMNLGWN